MRRNDIMLIIVSTVLIIESTIGIYNTMHQPKKLSDDEIYQNACEYLNDRDYINGIKTLCTMSDDSYRDDYISEVLYVVGAEAIDEYKLERGEEID